MNPLSRIPFEKTKRRNQERYCNVSTYDIYLLQPRRTSHISPRDASVLLHCGRLHLVPVLALFEADFHNRLACEVGGRSS